jgi:drug/metabolite transporter (DMT)-like permease
MIIVNYIISKSLKIKTDFPNINDFKILVSRNAIMILQTMILAISLKYLQAPTVHTISNSGPILVLVLDHFINKVQISQRQILGIIITIIGLLLTVNFHLLLYLVDEYG